jgi:hypothetical protein
MTCQGPFDGLDAFHPPHATCHESALLERAKQSFVRMHNRVASVSIARTGEHKMGIRAEARTER